MLFVNFSVRYLYEHELEYLKTALFLFIK